MLDKKTIAAIEELRRTNLDAQIVEIISQRMGLSARDALDVYYSSELAPLIERNEYGMQFLDAHYLADEILGNGVDQS